jgi:hypothetical protein
LANGHRALPARSSPRQRRSASAGFGGAARFAPVLGEELCPRASLRDPLGGVLYAKPAIGPDRFDVEVIGKRHNLRAKVVLNLSEEDSAGIADRAS